jgi:carbamoyl-phosphate synthase large subunit/carbamoyl-phosphate synthase small subunit
MSESKTAHPSPSLEDLEGFRKGRLVLEDGTEYEGVSFGFEGCTNGEVVFNTGMVGYPESLTDPSYKGQILVCTYPSIGNYGVPNDELDEFGLSLHFESTKVQIQALIVTDYCYGPSHYQSTRNLSNWLQEQKIPALTGIDTRALTMKLREAGTMLGKIVFGEEDIEFEDPNLRNLASEVSRTEPATYGNGRFKVIAVDCGMKNNIIRCLARLDMTLKVVPWNYDYTNEEYDGLFLSNGPGDPSKCVETIAHIRSHINADAKKPIFGICLGSQLLGLAAGAQTYKMPYGNRGMNQPCIDLRTGLCYITPQNHGFAIDNKSLPEGWKCLFVNANDHSNEGLIHVQHPFFSAQFHPEARGGPADTGFLFSMFVDYLSNKRIQQLLPLPRPIVPMKKVLLLGSGGLSIGQAGEFDYSGSQCIKALKEEGLTCVLVNPNIATVQTSEGMADKIYFLPVTPEFVERVIEKERPQGILLQFGGQTALNCGIQLEEAGVLRRYNVAVLGTPVATIQMTEDRKAFADEMKKIGESCAPSTVIDNMEDAISFATDTGYPVLIRAGFALGGLGSGFAANEAELKELVSKCLANGQQVIIDKSLKGWKEVEYEVVRDSQDNCITVCNMENFDPLGIHTGDSIVVAPSQTLTDREYFMLRTTAIKVIRHLGVVGECNIQYALDPVSSRFCIIEVNARLSRSSALASKATGYPLAYVAAKLALGKNLPSIPNSVTKTTCACFEPSLDYMVIKVPKWDLRKFSRVSNTIGSAMKSVGEVMAIGRTFEETFQKAVRMTDGSLDGFGDIGEFGDMTTEDLEQELTHPTDKRSFALAVALNRGYTVERLYELTHIDPWFLVKLQNIIKLQHSLNSISDVNHMSGSALRILKRHGFSDKQIARCLGLRGTGNQAELTVRAARKRFGVLPVVKQIDTLAAEYPAATNYLYMSYHGTQSDIPFAGPGEQGGVMVLGCGAYRIGSSCEFDWCAVSCLRSLRKLGFKSIMVNYNPETVSTDYDESDRLYFEELSLERTLDIYEAESSAGVVVSVGGQIPNNLARPLSALDVNILGTSPDSIDGAEDRSKFSAMLDDLMIDQPQWAMLTSAQAACKFANEVGYPVLVRPSYVLSGAAMNVAADDEALLSYLDAAASLSTEFPVVISKFILNAKEIEYDGVACNGQVINYGISEHIENAGVHSGDATLMLPAQKLYIETMSRIKKVASAIAYTLNITGPFNIQFLSKNNQIKVIECNLRSSRSFPFVSKTIGVNLVEQATRAMLGVRVIPAAVNISELEFVCCKAPMFSFSRMQGADPRLRVEMTSTGEVAAFASDPTRAYLIALLSTGFRLPAPRSHILLSVGSLPHKVELLSAVKELARLGFVLYGTAGTYKFYRDNGVSITRLGTPTEDAKRFPAVLNYLREGKIECVINIPNLKDTTDLSNGYLIRRTAVDFNVSLISNTKCTIQFVRSLTVVSDPNYEHEIRSWDEYTSGAFKEEKSIPQQRLRGPSRVQSRAPSNLAAFRGMRSSARGSNLGASASSAQFEFRGFRGSDLSQLH